MSRVGWLLESRFRRDGNTRQIVNQNRQVFQIIFDNFQYLPYSKNHSVCGEKSIINLFDNLVML